MLYMINSGESTQSLINRIYNLVDNKHLESEKVGKNLIQLFTFGIMPSFPLYLPLFYWKLLGKPTGFRSYDPENTKPIFPENNLYRDPFYNTMSLWEGRKLLKEASNSRNQKNCSQKCHSSLFQSCCWLPGVPIVK